MVKSKLGRRCIDLQYRTLLQLCYRASGFPYPTNIPPGCSESFNCAIKEQSYPPKARCNSITFMGSKLKLLYRNLFWHFQNITGGAAFRYLEHSVSPEDRREMREQNPYGVQLSFHMFYKVAIKKHV